MSPWLCPGIGLPGENIRWSVGIHTGVGLECFICDNFPCSSLSNSKCPLPYKKKFVFFFLNFGSVYLKRDKFFKITFSFFFLLSFFTPFLVPLSISFLIDYNLISEYLLMTSGGIVTFYFLPNCSLLWQAGCVNSRGKDGFHESDAIPF